MKKRNDYRRTNAQNTKWAEEAFMWWEVEDFEKKDKTKKRKKLMSKAL